MFRPENPMVWLAGWHITGIQSATISSEVQCYIPLICVTNRGRGYFHSKKEVSCTKQRAIIVGTVIGSLFGTSGLRVFTLFVLLTC